MPVPAQVQAQADKADAMLKELSEKEKAPAAVVTNPEDQGKDKPAPIPEETVESLKHKLAVLQGKYNSEIQALKDDVNLLNNLKNQVRTLNGQVQDANGKLNDANRLIGEMQKQITEKPAPADDGKIDLSALSEEDLEHLRGEGFDDKVIGILVKALSKKAAPAARTDGQGEIEEIRQDMEKDRAKAFWKEFTDKVPDWEPINTDDTFNDWLDEKLPYSTETRRDRLQAAQKDADAATCIQIFNDFKSAHPAAGRNKPEQRIELPSRIDPAKQLEPASSVVHQPPEDGKPKPAGKIYTRQEVREFYAELSKAAAKGNVTDEMKKTDQDIIAANTQGRIQG